MTQGRAAPTRQVVAMSASTFTATAAAVILMRLADSEAFTLLCLSAIGITLSAAIYLLARKQQKDT